MKLLGSIMKVLMLMWCQGWAKDFSLMQKKDLKVGDVLLQALDCRTCSMIEEQEKTPYSHMGMVIQTSPTILVAEAYGKVRQIELDEFHQKTEKNIPLLVRRLKKDRFDQRAQEFYLFFQERFEGLRYDRFFLWDNVDEHGQEMLYCSELVGKMLEGFFSLQGPLKRMSFDMNRSFWEKYFHGNVPDGEWGNSPGDFERSDLFDSVGVYE